MRSLKAFAKTYFLLVIDATCPVALPHNTPRGFVGYFTSFISYQCVGGTVGLPGPPFTPVSGGFYPWPNNGP